MKAEFLLRAHHGMCLQFYEGKGYSADFTDHMWRISKKMKENPVIRIISDADIICSRCPNLLNGKCNTFLKVQQYDNEVLMLCHLSPGTELTWNEFSSMVRECIIKTGKRKQICEGCRWNSICLNKEIRDF